MLVSCFQYLARLFLFLDKCDIYGRNKRLTRLVSPRIFLAWSCEILVQTLECSLSSNFNFRNTYNDVFFTFDFRMSRCDIATELEWIKMPEWMTVLLIAYLEFYLKLKMNRPQRRGFHSNFRPLFLDRYSQPKYGLAGWFVVRFGRLIQ